MRARLIRLGLAAIGLYFVWPALVKVFGSYHDLADIKPRWFIAMTLFEIASFVSVWLLVGIATSTRHWTLVATAQLVGNAVSSVVPGGVAAGGPLQYTYMVKGGADSAEVASGLATTSLLSTTTLFGLAALCVPVVLRMQHIDARLERAAVLGLIVFVVLLGIGAVAFTVDGFLRGGANAAQWTINKVRRRRPPTNGLAERTLEQRNRVRATLGRKWPLALVAAVSKWAFDYFALVAAVAATGVRVDPVPLMVAYVAAAVLGMIPITPSGLGFVEAGLAVTLVWAGLPTAAATLAVLAYRMVSYWLPLVAGIVAAVVYRRRYPAASGTSMKSPVQ
jgi:uncharacterized protein (TIRG00374 family)